MQHITETGYRRSEVRSFFFSAVSQMRLQPHWGFLLLSLCKEALELFKQGVFLVCFSFSKDPCAVSLSPVRI